MARSRIHVARANCALFMLAPSGVDSCVAVAPTELTSIDRNRIIENTHDTNTKLIVSVFSITIGNQANLII